MISPMTYAAVLSLLIMGAYAYTCRRKQVLLLAASYLFYGVLGRQFLFVLVLSSVCNYGIGVWVKRRPTLARLWLGILFNVSLLGAYKYLPVAGIFHDLVMPIGMSFWTFQALSYLFDLYREEELDPSIAEFCLYMAFWPTVLMGPICRVSNLLPQFRQIRSVDLSDVTEGFRRIGMGLFMKLILAQLLAAGVDAGFGLPSSSDASLQWSGLDVWLLAVGFGFQLFFDFAGYSHIAIGSARVFGYRIDENFNSPFLATTPSSFWTKWHMSLSFWIRDYVFVPLATLRRGAWWRYVALLLSMVLFGLWHGSRLTYLAWGAYHGVLLVAHRMGQQLRRKYSFHVNPTIGLSLSWLATFLSMSLAWVAFRANDLRQAALMFEAVFSPRTYRNSVLPADFCLTVVAVAVSYFAYETLRARPRALEGGRSFDFFKRFVNRGLLGKRLHFLRENSWLWAAPMFVVLAILWALVVSFRAIQVSPFVYSAF